MFDHLLPNTIAICNTTISSTGWYSCVAINIAGTTEYSIYVNVTADVVPPTIVSRSQSRVVAAGESLILDCITAGYPLPTVTWFKDGVSSKYRFDVEVRFLGKIET